MGFLLQWTQASDVRMGCPTPFQTPNICQVDMLTLKGGSQVCLCAFPHLGWNFLRI